MAGETVITVVGNLTNDPELKFTPSGAAVANFTVASTPRTFDRQTNEWKDGDPLFIRCDAWRQMAENVAESLQKGARVVVTGSLRVRNFERQDGSKGTSVEMNVDEVGPSLKWATAKVTKASAPAAATSAAVRVRRVAAVPTRGRQPAAQGSAPSRAVAPQQGGPTPGAGGGGSTDEPPF